MATVYNKDGNKSVEQMIKEFKKEVDKEEILTELKNREYFKKDSILRHEEKKKREIKVRRRAKKLALSLAL
jgi:ribosomal protein S21